MKVCWFSTGVSSFIACYLMPDIDEIIYTHIENQHPDSLRFLRDCEELLGRKITVLQSKQYKSVDDVIESHKYINGVAGAPCTLELKKRVRQEWERKNGIGHTYVWGFDLKERKRADRMVELMPEFNHEFPLINKGITKQECHGICGSLGLKRPIMYDLGYPNNNCIGCVKGGMGYWNRIRVDFPEVFKRRAQQEREIGHSCIKGMFLDQLNPARGNMNTEVFEECGVACYLIGAERR